MVIDGETTDLKVLSDDDENVKQTQKNSFRVVESIKCELQMMSFNVLTVLGRT